jgi:ECF transporter S component (folate family)
MKEIRKITFAALLAAIASVLKIYSLQLTDTMRISVFPIPLILAGFYLGPTYGLMVGFVTDTAYWITSPNASFWSLYTITTMVWGLSGFLAKKMRFKHNVVSFSIVILLTSIFETVANTYFHYLIGIPYLVTLVPRIITMFVRLPILVYLTIILVEKLKVLKIDESLAY